MERNTRYLHRFRDIIETVAKRQNIDSKDLEEMIDHFFRTMKSFIVDPRMPSIKITNFGTFKPTIGKLNKHIRLSLTSIRESRKVEHCKAKIKHLWQVRRRLVDERNGGITWKEWRNKKLNIEYSKTGKNAKEQNS